MPTDTPDLVSEFEDQKQSAPNLVQEFEQQKTVQSQPDFTQEALSGKLAPVTGKPSEPKGQPYIDRAGMEHETEAVPEAAGWSDPLIHIAAGVEPIATGLSRIKDNSAPPASPEMPMARSRGGPAVLPQAPHTPEQVQRDRQTMLGAAEVLQGAGQLGTVAVPASIAAAPLKTALGFGAGYLASEGAGKAVHGKVSPEAEELTRATAFFIPSALGVASGLKSGTIETPQGKFSAASAFGGKVRGGVATTPEAFDIRGQVGGTTLGVRIPRNGAPAPAAAPAPTLDEGTAAMVAYGQSTGEIAKPVPPPTPGQQFGNKLSGDQVDHLAQTIAKAPPAQQNALIEEAHANMAKWINDNKGKVFIDGKIVLAKSPDQVEALAAKIINDASSAHDKAQDLAAKEADKAQKETEKQSTAKTARASAAAPAPKPAAAPARVKAQPQAEAPQSQPAAEKPVVQKVEEKPAHDFASTQVDIDPKSELGQQHAQAVVAMPEDHIGPNGKEDTPHVTVRYGLKDDSPEAIAKIKEAASKIAPFEATVGKTSSFPATKEGDRPIIAQVEKSPELNALRSVVEAAGDFKEDTHGEYKPHVTLGYVKPEHVAKYEGGDHLEGGKVPVDHIVVSKKDRTSEVIKLGGKPVPDLVAQHEATPDLVAEHEGANQRKPENAELRARFDKMSPEERSKALVEYHERERTSDTVDLPNKLAFTEAEHAGKSPAVAMSDADGLKAFNDKYGYEAGNTLLRAKADSLKEAGIDAYHDKGDEFLHRGASAEDLKAKLELARKSLRNKEFTVTDATGKQVTLKGVDFSYGTGTDLDTAEKGLKSHKAEREAAGERARGELRGITEVGSEAASKSGTEEVKLPEGIPAKGQAGRVPVKSLTLAPKEFQYKLNTNEHGVTNLLSGQKWNDDLAGVVSVWHNPASGKTYVVNGHHRVQLAKQNGQKDLLARHLNVGTASEARAAGALQNIAEGRGTAVDAAKFFRERGITPADLDKHGISLGEATAENGLALSNLHPYIFDKVVSGELSQGRGIAIGKATENPATQEAILKLIEKAEKRGRRITDGQVSELARFAGRAKETTTEEGGLFGKSFRTENNALDKAEVSDYIKQKLAQEKRVFGSVSSEDKAAVLGQVKDQNIKAGANQKIALEAAQAGELYDKLSASRGPLDDILETAAQRIAKRENPATAKADAYKQTRAELRKTLPGVEGPGTDGPQGRSGTGKEVEREAGRQASVKATGALEPLRKRKPSADEPALPGMAPHIEANKESAATTQGEDLSKKLTETKSISGKTGEMERSSPLFRDTEASGQTGLFGEKLPTDINELHKRGIIPPDTTAEANRKGFRPGQTVPDITKHRPFKAWFGKSKVVNPDGSPMVVYHGTDKDFNVFKSAPDDIGIHFGTPEQADHRMALKTSKYFPGTRIVPVFLKIENPLRMGDVGQWDAGNVKFSLARKFPEDANKLKWLLTEEQVRDFIKKKGYDGIVYKNEGEAAPDGTPTSDLKDSYIVFDPKQVKSATGNRGTFSPDSGNILHSGVDPIAASRAVVQTARDISYGAGKVADYVKDAIAKTAEARSVDDKLFGLSKQYEADVLRAVELMKQVGPLSTPEDQAAIYHHLEDASVPLDPKQQAVLDKIVKPMMKQSSEIRAKLNDAGIPMGEAGYVHRVLQGRSSQLERAVRGKQGTGKGNVLSKSAASLKQRKMFALEDEEGNRQVVSMEGGRITGFSKGTPNDLGASPRLKVGDNFNDKTGKPWTLQQATTKEIEANTNLKYYKNALASAVTDYLQLLRAKRANDALESMKADPGFNEMAFKSEKGSMPPDGWQSVNLPQFRDYYFEPHMAEVLNRFAKELHPDPVTFLEKVGNFMTASLLLNPIRHIYNIGNHWLVERGVSGTFNPLTWPTAAKAGVKAIKAVVNQNDDFLSALDHGAPMMSHRTDLQALHHELFQTIMGHLEKNPGIADQIAKFTGWDKANAEDTGVVNVATRGSGLRMLNNLRKLGQKAMWMSNDMMMLQSAYEKMANGADFTEAMKQTERHIPNYRIPTRIMNSKGMADFMGSRLASMFGRYHYGVWRSYGEMLKESFSPGSTPKERLRGLDHMIMLGLITLIMYPLFKKLLEKITGNPDARMVVSGASAAPNSIKEIIQGHEDPSQLLRNTFTPAILPQAAAEAMFNRDFFSGAPIRNPKHSAGKQVIDVSKHFMNALGPVQQYNQANRNPHPARSFLLSQVGVSTNHPKKHH